MKEQIWRSNYSIVDSLIAPHIWGYEWGAVVRDSIQGSVSPAPAFAVNFNFRYSTFCGEYIPGQISRA